MSNLFPSPLFLLLITSLLLLALFPEGATGEDGDKSSDNHEEEEDDGMYQEWDDDEEIEGSEQQEVKDEGKPAQSLQEFHAGAQKFAELKRKQHGMVDKGEGASHSPSLVMVVGGEGGAPEEALLTATTTTEESTSTTEEAYADAIERLSCDNPWFWNSFKCLYLDVKERNYVERTQSNAVTVAWILGPPLSVILLIIILACVSAWCIRARVKALERKMNDIMEKYSPGSIVLDDGTVRKYEPTKEEINAFENMISTLIAIV